VLLITIPLTLPLSSSPELRSAIEKNKVFVSIASGISSMPPSSLLSGPVPRIAPPKIKHHPPSIKCPCCQDQTLISQPHRRPPYPNDPHAMKLVLGTKGVNIRYAKSISREPRTAFLLVHSPAPNRPIWTPVPAQRRRADASPGLLTNTQSQESLVRRPPPPITPRIKGCLSNRKGKK
jgi:hypothetical protein